MGIQSFFVAIIVLALHVDARSTVILKKIAPQDIISFKEGHSLDGLTPEFICDSCLKVSSEVEKALADPKFLEKVSMISNKTCSCMPSDLQKKCLEMSDMYIHQAVSFLQDFFSEENFCNSTGLCHENIEPILSSKVWKKDILSASDVVNQILNDNLKKLTTEAQSRISFKVNLQSLAIKRSDDKSCTACRKALNEVLDDLQKPETKIKFLKFLLKACEEVDNHVKECKKLVFSYGPLILANVEKFLTKNDLCVIMGACSAGHHAQVTDA